MNSSSAGAEPSSNVLEWRARSFDAPLGRGVVLFGVGAFVLFIASIASLVAERPHEWPFRLIQALLTGGIWLGNLGSFFVRRRFVIDADGVLARSLKGETRISWPCIHRATVARSTVTFRVRSGGFAGSLQQPYLILPEDSESRERILLAIAERRQEVIHRYVAQLG